MNKVNKNNETRYISLLCIQSYENPPPVMALVECNGEAAPPSLKDIKKWPSLHKILFYFFIVVPGRYHPKMNTFFLETTLF